MIKFLFKGFTSQKIQSLSSQIGQTVTIQGRVQTVRAKGNLGFLILRQDLETVQCCIFKSPQIPKEQIKQLAATPNESIVEIKGEVKPTESKTSCSISNIELQIQEFKVLNKAGSLPFSYEEGLITDRVSLKTRLDHRVMDIRLPLTQSIIKSSSQICQSFRDFLLQNQFIEIHTPKLIQGVSEGGSDVFRTSYFTSPACLAQSPQLYKQMAVLGDLDRVFEIGQVFRAENSNTHRHLCEFTGLDLEMTISEDYFEVVNLVKDLLLCIFGRLKDLKESQVIYKSFETTPATLDKIEMFSYEEMSDLLNKNGIKHEMFQDFSLEHEKNLGKIIKEKYGTDFYVVFKYPTCVRPFYSRPCAEDKRFCEAFDVFLRGEEIASGAGRIFEYDELARTIAERGIEVNSVEAYLSSFKYGAPKHGGCGLGLERLLMLYYGIPNIRYASLFPRDPKRLTP